LVVATSGVRWVAGYTSSLLADHRLAGRVEAKVSLGHELLIEGRVHTAVGVEVASVVHLLLPGALTTALEKLGQDGLLLLVHVSVAAVVDLESLTLDRVVELSLALSLGV
jgi:hypothetical protein